MRGGSPIRAHLARVLLAFGGLASTRPAQAQPARDPAAADELFNRGKALLAAGNWVEACAKFQASMDLDPSVGTLIKIGRCHEHDGRLALALHDYDAALVLNREKTGQTERRRADLERFTQSAISQLEPRVPKIRVVLTERPKDLRVTRSGEKLPLAALGEALPVDPGSVEIVADAPGFETERRAVVLGEGQTSDVLITLKPLPAAVSSPLPSLERSPPAQPRDEAPGPARTSAPLEREPPGGWTPRKSLAVVIGGAGLVTLGVSAGYAVETRAKVSDAVPYCDRSYRCHQAGIDLLAQASKDQTIALVLLGVGAPVVAAGVYLLLSPASSPYPPVTVGATVGAGPSGVVLRGQW